MRKRKSFSPEFKREAVRLMESSGKLPTDLARELGIPRNRLYKWKEQLEKRGADAFPGKGQRCGEGEEVSQLKADARESQRGARHFKKGSRVLCQGAQVKYAFVRAHHREFSIKRMCQVLEISRSGYYDWHDRKECGRSQRDQILFTEIRKIHQDTKEAYGAIKTWRALKEAGISCGKPPRGTTETAGRYRSSAQTKISRGVSGAS